MAGPYNPHHPSVLQSRNWNCSCASATWALQSLGFPATEAEVTSEMLARGLVTPEYGLMDASGAGLAAYLREKTGLPVVNRYLTWEDMTAASGYGPICNGSNALYHWVATRYVDDDAVHMANPAPGYRGVGDVLDRWSWESLSPWAGVMMLPGEDIEMVEQLQAENAQLKEQVASLEAELQAERSWCSSAMADTVVPVTATLDMALLTKRPEDWDSVQAAASSLHANLGV